MSGDNVGWKSERTPNVDGESGGNPAIYALDGSLDGFCRDAFQNVLDARQDGVDTVEATVYVDELTGEDLAEFKKALDWASDDPAAEDLGTHLERVAEQKAAVRKFLDEVESEDRLVVVTLEDEYTEGLTGEEGGDGHFARLVQDELNTEKLNADSGSLGSYGLGKFVFPQWSAMSTVLFTSNLPTPLPGEANPRFIARAFLPSHTPEDDEATYTYAGDAYFGQLSESDDVVIDAGEDLYKWGDGQGRPLSVWGDTAASLVGDLGVHRADTHGTSITVPGFSEPGSGTQREDLEALGDDIATAVSRWFWPAITAGRLDATVETPADTIDVTADYCPAVEPLVQGLRYRDTAIDQLRNPGDVAVRTPTIEIPDEDDGTPTENGPVEILARQADPNAADATTELRDTVALVRGSGMVVKYYDLSHLVYGDQHFHGILLAGRARAWDGTLEQSDRDIDDYLKAAEPPAHDEWEVTANLRSQYGSGYQARLDDLRRTVRDEIKDLLETEGVDGRRVAGELARRLGIGTGGGPPEPPRPPAFDSATDLEYDGRAGQWELECQLAPRDPDHLGWEADVGLQRVSEEGRKLDDVRIADLTADRESVTVTRDGDGFHLDAPESVDTVTLTGTSVTDADAAETRLRVVGEVTLEGDA